MPKHVSTLYDDDDTVIYQTDGYGGTHNDVDNTERFTDDIDLTIRKGVSVDFKFDGSNATDDLNIKLYKRRDSTWEGTESAWKSTLVISNSGSETIYHYTIPRAYEPGHYRFGLVSEGATTTFEIEVSLREWRDTDTIS